MIVGKTCANDVISLNTSSQAGTDFVRVDNSDRLVLSLQMPLSEDYTQGLSNLFENEMPTECPLTQFRIGNVTSSSGNLTEAEYLPMLGISFGNFIVRQTV